MLCGRLVALLAASSNARVIFFDTHRQRISITILIDTLALLSKGRGLTADNLNKDFDRKSDSQNNVVIILVDSLNRGTVLGRALC